MAHTRSEAHNREAVRNFLSVLPPEKQTVYAEFACKIRRIHPPLRANCVAVDKPSGLSSTPRVDTEATD